MYNQIVVFFSEPFSYAPSNLSPWRAWHMLNLLVYFNPYDHEDGVAGDDD
jgi:hypothetical protein